MKILMVNKFLYPKGGAETYMLLLGNNLASRGHKVEYFGMYHPDNIVGNQWNLYTKPVDFHKQGRRANLVNPWKIICSSEAGRKMEKLLREFQPDVVHINNFNYQLTPSILLAVEKYRKKEQKTVKVVYTAHDSQLVCPNHYLYQPLQKKACDACLTGGFANCVRKKCIHNSTLRSFLGAMEGWYWKRRKVYGILDVILCPSAFMKKALDTNPLLASKTVYLQNFVNPTACSDDKQGDYVLYFGRYSEEKGIETLLEVCKELPQIPFVFAGSGPLEELIRDIPNVQNIGFLRGKALQRTIRGARFSVCPSECNENCPLSVMESIMNGTPVLGTKRGGIPELIEEGKTGWLIEAGEKEQLREKILEIWGSSEPEKFSDFCRNVTFLSLEEYEKKLLQFYTV
ncbi:MAG: glycosyltransferase family 4 protein [Lachnospiraceae bacterium]|nr:glycosyltransferase family 4 protein [Lachnospiraceae bacterium]